MSQLPIKTQGTLSNLNNDSLESFKSPGTIQGTAPGAVEEKLEPASTPYENFLRKYTSYIMTNNP